jgi:hypothetical protein
MLSSEWVCVFGSSSQSGPRSDLAGCGGDLRAGGMIRRMGRRRQLQRRPVLLALAASTAVLTGHLLDALGLLPGVHEPLAVRAAALAPRYTMLTALGAALLAVAAEGLLRRRRAGFATLLLVIGQTALLGLPEAMAESAGRAGPAVGGGEAQELAKLAVAVGLQVLLAALAVGVAVVVDTALLRLPRALQQLAIPGFPRATAVVPALLLGRIVGGVRGRGPPVPVLP